MRYGDDVGGGDGNMLGFWCISLVMSHVWFVGSVLCFVYCIGDVIFVVGFAIFTWVFLVCWANVCCSGWEVVWGVHECIGDCRIEKWWLVDDVCVYVHFKRWLVDGWSRIALLLCGNFVTVWLWLRRCWSWLEKIGGWMEGMTFL